MTADAAIGKKLSRWLGAASRRTFGGRLAPGSDAVLLLEDRILLDAEASVAITAPASVALGSSFGITLTFDNAADGDPGSSVGYSPYIDLVLPTTGKDGAGTEIDDGISFGSATFLGAAVKSTVITFDVLGNATHPFALDASGNPRIVTGTPGDSLVVLTLPFGSFTADQTPADIKVTLNLSPLADFDPAHISDALQISARGGFAFGRDPLANAVIDPPVLQPVATLATISPSLLTLSKIANTPEGETATGPNFPRTYTIDLDVATGQTITAAHILDLLPANIVYLGSSVSIGSGSLVTQPGAGSIINPASNLLDYDFGTITGAAGVDARITVTFYVADVAGTGAAVINPVSGSPTATVNNVQATGNFVPLDPRDAIAAFVDDRTPNDNIVTNRSIAIQKASVLAMDNNVPGLSPGDVVTYTLNVQLSDYFTAGDIRLTDLLGDGQRLDTTFTPVFTVVERGVSTGQLTFAGTVAAGGELVGGNFISVFNPVVGTPGAGTTTLTIALSNEIDARNLFPDGDGILAGGRTQIGDAALLTGATTLSISFRAIVQNNFVAPQVLGQVVNQGDQVADNAAVNATVRNNTSLAATGNINDVSALVLPIEGGSVQSKESVAVNGVAPVLLGGVPQLTQGDTITFRLRYSLPTSAVENFRLTDFLPLPVLPATQLVQSGGAIGTIPAVNQWNYGSADTFHLLPGAPTPVALAPSVTGNSFTFNYGNYAAQNAPGGAPQASIVELLFTVRVADAPFGDGLLLTNQITASESNAQAVTVTTNAITQFNLTQPALTITKGVVDTAFGNPAYQGSRSPATVSFANATGNPGPAAFTGQITDAALATGAINANLRGIDAGDKVTFAITVNNNGTGNNGAFDVAVRDLLPAGFAIPIDATGLNLKVTTGAGAAAAFTNIGGGAGLFDQGIILIDGSTGAIARDTDGIGTMGTTTNDIIIITYDLVATSAVQPNQTWTNTATLTGYAALEGGTNFVPAGLTDSATVTTRAPGIVKVLTATDQAFTSGAAVAIGETATFRITYTLPEGSINNVILRDNTVPAVSAGVLTPISATIISIGNGITGPGVPAVGAGGTLTGSSFNFDLGNVIVAGDNDPLNDTIVVEVVTQIANNPLNARGDVLVNEGRILYTTTNPQTGALVLNQPNATASVTVLTPDLELAKSISTVTADAGDPVIYTLRLTNPSVSNAATAFDITAIDNDLVSLGFTGIGIVSVTSLGATNVAATDTAGTITITADSLNVGGNITVQFTATLGNVLAGTTLTNSARITQYSTLPGAIPGERVITNEAPVSASLIVPGVALTKTLITTSINNDANPQVQIGETATFDIVATLPEGSVPLTIADLLPSGANVLNFVSATVLSIGGNTTAGATSGGSLSNSAIGVGTLGVISGGGTTATFNFGTIANSPDGVMTAGDRIVIRVVTLVPDVAANTAADNIVTNTASANFGAGTTTATSSLAIVEPVVAIAKLGPAGVIDAGARLGYSFTITNNGDGIAYDVVVTDPLTANLTLVPGSISFSGALSGTASSFAGIAIPALAPGQSITVSYQADVGDGVVLGTSIVNTATVNYDSLPGAGNIGRVPSPPPSSSAMVPTGGAVAIDKTIVNTSVGNDTSANVVIGEIVTYRLTTNLPDGTTTLSLADTLPSGLDYVVGSGRVVSMFGISGGSAIISSGSSSSSVTFNFGTITNPGDNVANPDQTVVVELQARVADIAANQAGSVRTNNAVATTGLGGVTDPTPPAVTITAPALALDKTTVRNTATSGDIIAYRVVLNHLPGSTAAANDISLTDSLAGGTLSLVPGSLVIVSGPGSIVAGSTVNVSIPVLALGQSTVIEYRALVGSVAAGADISNTATASFDSLPGPGPGGRTDNVADTVNLGVPGLIKTIAVAGTSDANTGDAAVRPGVTDLGIGEVATIILSTVLPRGTATNITLTDTLTVPAGLLGFDPASVSIRLGSSVLAPSSYSVTPVDSDGDGIADRVSFTIASLTIPGAADPAATPLVISYRATALDVPANVRGDALDLPVTLAFNTPTGAATPLTAIAGVDLVTPTLSLGKAVVKTVVDVGSLNGLSAPGGALAGTAGDVFAYTITIGHAAGSNAPAYDLRIADALGNGLVLVAGSASTSLAGATVTPTANGLTVNAAALLPGQSFTVSYQARIADSTLYGATLPNAARLDYDTLAGAGGRSFDAGAAAAVTLQGSATITKAIIATGNPLTGNDQFNPANPDVTVGETITYRITATLAEGTTPSFIITDRLPSSPEAVVEYLASARPVLGAGITAQFPNPVPVLTDTDGDGRVDTIRFDFGRVTNAGDNRIDAGDTITIDVSARVPDDARNTSGDLLVATARIDAATSGATITASAIAAIDVVEPRLVIDKSVAEMSRFPGEIATYTLTLRHAPGSTAAAADVVVRDLLTPGLTLVPGSLVIVSAPVGFPPVVTGTSVAVAALPLGSTLVYTFRAVVGFTTDTTVPLVNTASVVFDSVPGPGGRPGSTSDTAALIVQAPGMIRREQVLPDWHEDRYVEELPHIDQIYSGSAQPGARVTIRIADAAGGPAGVASVTADAGGNWLALMPTVKATDLMRTDRQAAWFERSALFSDSSGLGKVLAEGLGDRLHRVTNGADFADAPYALNIEQSPAGFALDDAAASNLRGYFAPAWRDQLFADQPLSIETIFRDVASTAVVRDFAAAVQPLGFGVNAFNAEFLANALPGATH